MIAIILFILGLYCYEIRKDRVPFYLIIQFLAMNAYSLLNWDHSPIRTDDLALFMVLYAFFREGIRQKITTSLTIAVYAYLAIILACALVSFFYYQIPLVQVFKGARTSLYVLMLFDLKNMKSTEFQRLFLFIFAVSSFAAFMYSYTVLTGTIPESALAGTGFLGLPRSFNTPPLIAFNCLYVVFVFDKQNKLFIPLLILSFLTLFLIQSRGMLIAVLLSIAVGVSLKASKSNRVLISFFAIALFLFLISNLVFSGETGDKTMNDISKISSGEFARNDFEHESDATFSYRLNLLAISLIKTFDEPMRIFFGSGLLVEMPLSFFEKWGMLESARYSLDGYTFFSPDISLSNIIYNIGILGLIIYSYLIYTLWKLLVRRAKDGKNYEIVGAMFVFYLILIAFDGSRLTWPNYLIIPFFFVQYADCRCRREVKVKILLLLFLYYLKKRMIPTRAMGRIEVS